jgi:uncharacterized membrane protein
MLNLEKLKALANEAIADECWEPLLGLTGAETEFAKAASPDVVLELIAELERLREKVRGVETARTSRNAEMDGKVLNYLRDRTGSTAWAMTGAIGATREEVSKACQRLRRKGLIETSATQLTYWQAVKA